MTDEPLDVQDAAGSGIEVPERLTDAELPEIDADMGARLDAMASRARVANERHRTEVLGRPSSSSRIDAQADKGLATGMAAAMGFIAAPVAMFLLGWAIELFAGGNWKVPLAGVGVCLGFVYLLVMQKRDQ